MKYLIVIPDGMADYPVVSLGGRTPMECAKKPVMDRLAATAAVGTVSNVPAGMVPESDTANLAVMSYDPAVYSKGRSPLEATAMGLTMAENDTAFRCNIVTLSEESELADRTMIDHSADEITTGEADGLVRALDEALGRDGLRFHTGVSYRHCLLWRDAPDFPPLMRPHDILGQNVAKHLAPEPIRSMMERSFEILNHHPINEARRARGLRPANSIWLWSPGKKPALPSFKEKWGLDVTIVSAVDLIKGIGICAGAAVPDVEGATGNINTNFDGKAQAAIDAFRGGSDLVYIHVEAPDECGHRAEAENKVRAIELIDAKILGPVTDYLAASGEPYRVMVLPDHPTPVILRTHVIDPVPFLIYDPAHPCEGVGHFTEGEAARTGMYVPAGTELMGMLVR